MKAPLFLSSLLSLSRSFILSRSFLLFFSRGKHHSGTDVNEGSAIQEKCYAPRFIQVPQDLTVEEGRFCRIDFKVQNWIRSNQFSNACW